MKKFALPGLAALAFIALIVGLIGAFAGPSNKDVTSKADAATVTAVEQRLATIESAVTNLPTSADISTLSAEIADLRQDLTNLPDYGPGLADLTARIATVEERIEALEAAAAATPEPVAAQPTAEPTAAPTTQPTAQGQAGWANLPDGRQVWIGGPEANASVHIEFISVDPAATEAQIGLAGGEALHAFAVMGGNAQGCEVQVAPMRDKTILSCPTAVVVQFAVSQDGELVTVAAPEFGGSGYLTFGEVASLLRQTRQSVEKTLLVEPNAGFFLAWVATQPISGLYIP